MITTCAKISPPNNQDLVPYLLQEIARDFEGTQSEQTLMGRGLVLTADPTVKKGEGYISPHNPFDEIKGPKLLLNPEDYVIVAAAANPFFSPTQFYISRVREAASEGQNKIDLAVREAMRKLDARWARKSGAYARVAVQMTIEKNLGINQSK